MMTSKHFIAINNETDERIEFDVGDISFNEDCNVDYDHYSISLGKRWFHFYSMTKFLKNHTLYYLHQGVYYNYETGEEMI